MNFRRNRPREQGYRNEYPYLSLLRRVFRQSRGTVVMPEAGIRVRNEDFIASDEFDNCPQCAEWRDAYETKRVEEDK